MSDRDSPETGEVGMWPSLHEAHGVVTPPPRDSGDDWEVLCSDENVEHEEEMVVVQIHPKGLKHAASSPDFLKFTKVAYPIDEEPDYHEDSSQEDTSHVMVSSPPSVISGSTVPRVSSFRDAILLQKQELAKEQTNPQRPAIPRAPRYAKARLVVKPIKRCAKSTGDLQSLIVEEEEEILGETDAMDYYPRKAKGHAGRRSGRIERPDEAKRKAISIYKKQLQREQQARKG